MKPTVLDSGALSAWAQRDRRVVAALEAVRRAGGYVLVPTVVIGESTTGEPGRDAPVNRRLNGCVADPCNEQQARRGAALRYASGAAGEISVVDAVVAATAEGVGGRVLTDDANDLRRLTAGTSVDVIALEQLR